MHRRTYRELTVRYVLTNMTKLFIPASPYLCSMSERRRPCVRGSPARCARCPKQGTCDRRVFSETAKPQPAHAFKLLRVYQPDWAPTYPHRGRRHGTI